MDHTTVTTSQLIYSTIANIFSLLPSGVNTITIEIFDERSFTMDELIAWTQITIPPSVFAGQTHEEWFPLSGKQGEGLEGTISLVLSYSVSTKTAYWCYVNWKPVFSNVDVELLFSRLVLLQFHMPSLLWWWYLEPARHSWDMADRTLQCQFIELHMLLQQWNQYHPKI